MYSINKHNSSINAFCTEGRRSLTLFSKLRNFTRLDIIVPTVSFRKIMKNMARPQFEKYEF
jgi:hypothetical protein